MHVADFYIVCGAEPGDYPCVGCLPGPTRCASSHVLCRMLSVLQES